MNSEAAVNLPPPKIDISVQDPTWEMIGGIEDIVRQTAAIALTSAILPKFAYNRALEVSLVLANDDLMQVLNREYRKKDKATNVLTFATLDSEEPSTKGVLNLGDVILSYQTIKREAQEQGKSLVEHTKHLTVHGLLHLLGYNHKTENQATDMETLEIRILEKIGVQNPYTETDFIL